MIAEQRPYHATVEMLGLTIVVPSAMIAE